MTVAADLTYLPWVGAAASTDAPCVRDERRELSYRDIERAAAAVAEQFAEHGVGRGDVVAVMLPNSVELLVAVLAAWRLGAAATPVNPTFTAREVGYQVADARAAVLVGAPVEGIDLPTIPPGELRRDRPATPETSAEHAEDAAAAAATADVQPVQLALLVYTSGSTGQPKGVMLDHANLAAMAAQATRHFAMTERDHALLVLPLFHVNSLCLSFCAPLSVGAQVSVLERFAPDTFVRALAERRPTLGGGGAAHLARAGRRRDRPSVHRLMRTAEELGVHRNTVRQRVTRFEAGRAGPIDRVELTLALCLHAAFG